MNNITIVIVIIVIIIIIIIIIIVIEMPSNYWFFICSMYTCICIRHMYTLTHTLLIIFSELYLLSVLIL